MLIKMNLQNNFTLVPAGERVLTITKAEVKPSGKPSAMHVTFKDEVSGGILTNRYDFSSQGALIAMSIMINYALGLNDGDDFDTTVDTPRLVGKKLICEVTHTQGTKPGQNGKIPTFANISKVLGSYTETNTTPVSSTNLSPREQIIGNDLD